MKSWHANPDLVRLLIHQWFSEMEKKNDGSLLPLFCLSRDVVLSDKPLFFLVLVNLRITPKNKRRGRENDRKIHEAVFYFWIFEHVRYR